MQNALKFSYNRSTQSDIQINNSDTFRMLKKKRLLKTYNSFSTLQQLRSSLLQRFL